MVPTYRFSSSLGLGRDGPGFELILSAKCSRLAEVKYLKRMRQPRPWNRSVFNSLEIFPAKTSVAAFEDA